ncbi:PA-phosphatase [Candidatus Peregrinibacteria bacterium CG_4_9_14_0_2_um_filter_53_11]|nr:MAG: PA-phosphatase [Candidatus Peregrinibacteria bacterium CG_4_9_14_0_2_um_filter_53_11]
MDLLSLLFSSTGPLANLSYWIVFVAALLETTIGIGLFIPGSTIIFFMGALAAQGSADVSGLLIFSSIGALLGDNLNYYIGKKTGPGVIERGIFVVKPRYFKRGERFYRRRGDTSIFFGRFLPVLKETVPLVAGALGMSPRRFFLWNLLGAIGWSLVLILPGYFLAQSLNLAALWLTRAGFFAVILFVLFVLLYFVRTFLISRGRVFFRLVSSISRSIKSAIRQNPDVKSFMARHKKIRQFIRDRLSRKSFYGLPLTFLSIALLYAIFLFAGVVEGFVNADPVVLLDVRVANLLAIFRSDPLTQFFLWITLLGQWQIATLVVVALIVILLIWKKLRYIPPLLLCVLGGQLFTTAGKVIFQRPRPGVALYTESSFSFPSGHATIAIALYGFIAYMLIRHSRRWGRKVNLFFAGAVLIGLIGFSRLYLGVHYFSDVWGGYLAGAIWLIIGISFLEYFSYKKMKEEVRVVPKRRLLTVGVLSATSLSYAFFGLNYSLPAVSPPPVELPTVVGSVTDIFEREELKFTETLFGAFQEPMNVIIIAQSDEQLVSLFEEAGWLLADEVSISSLAQAGWALVSKESYPRAPMTPDFWNAEIHNFGFQKATEVNLVSTRHHTRFWRTMSHTEEGGVIYLGTASFDASIKWGVTHRIDPDIDTEREFLLADLQETGRLKSVRKEQLVAPHLGSNFAGDPFFTDGKTYVIEL